MEVSGQNTVLAAYSTGRGLGCPRCVLRNSDRKVCRGRRRLSAVHLLGAQVQILPREWLSVVRYRSLPRADSSSRGVPPNAVCLSVIVKPR